MGKGRLHIILPFAVHGTPFKDDAIAPRCEFTTSRLNRMQSEHTLPTQSLAQFFQG